MRAVAGIWKIGMMPGRLQRKMKMNSDSRNGVQPRPSLPIVCMTMPSSMKSTDRLGQVAHALRCDQRVLAAGER